MIAAAISVTVAAIAEDLPPRSQRRDLRLRHLQEEGKMGFGIGVQAPSGLLSFPRARLEDDVCL